MTTKQKSEEEQLNEVIYLLWRNYPRGGISTFGPCQRKACGSSLGARGSGSCATCLEKDLAALVGETSAGAYHLCIRSIRRFENKFEEQLTEQSEAAKVTNPRSVGSTGGS